MKHIWKQRISICAAFPDFIKCEIYNGNAIFHLILQGAARVTIHISPHVLVFIYKCHLLVITKGKHSYSPDMFMKYPIGERKKNLCFRYVSPHIYTYFKVQCLVFWCLVPKICFQMITFISALSKTMALQLLHSIKASKFEFPCMIQLSEWAFYQLI